MTYALDTNIISYILNKDAVLAAKLDNVIGSGNHVVIPLMAYYEIWRGLLAKNAPDKTRLFSSLCLELGIHDLTIADMYNAAKIYADRKRCGMSIEDADLLIAAQALTNGYTLVTHNIRHFENIDGLDVEDWAE